MDQINISPENRQNQFKHKIAKYFWWVNPKNIEDVNTNSVVEATLNYGTEQEVKELLDTYTPQAVAKIFREDAFKPRVNYLSQVKHFFTLFFDRHVPQHSH